MLYYESFVTEPLAQERTIEKIACFEQQISDDHISWLASNDIEVIWSSDEDGFDGTSQAKSKLEDHARF